MSIIAKIPETVFIGEAEPLYTYENRLHKAFKVAAHELGQVLQIPMTRYWEETVPAALMAMLESQQRESAVAAAVGFLRAQGFDNLNQITKVGPLWRGRRKSPLRYQVHMGEVSTFQVGTEAESQTMDAVNRAET